ncbi:MAG: fibronectin type III domain-containing protein [Acidobacteria bacterium]|nr:fibronectin type III domain-containing protein [Acidobacteriota bacterium]
MAKSRTTRSKNQPATPPEKSRNRRGFVIAAIILSFLMTGGALAQWTGVFPLTQKRIKPPVEIAPANLDSASPAKEYIYAGGKLVATEEPQGASCSYTISPTSQAMSASGGTGSVNVSAGAGCTWTALSNDLWITVTSGASGTGNGVVGYSVTANSGAARSGTVTIAGQTFTLNQASAPGCTYSISPISQAFTANGGTGSVSVTTTAGCAWTAASNAAWITITTGASGTGNGTVNYAVSANSVTSPRTGTLTLAGQVFTVNQDAAPGCTFSISPTALNVSAAAGSGTVSVTTTAGCSWTATSNAAWITITGGASGTGNGTVNYSYSANGTAQRTGTLTIAGQTFTLTQASSCTYSITPTAQSVPQAGLASGSFMVSATAGCSWTASVSQAWIHVSTTSGIGDTTVTYSVDANLTSSIRTGVIQISGSGSSLTLTQDALVNNAGFVSQNIPSSIFPGAGQSVTVTMMNTGNINWTTGNYVLRSQNPAANTTWGISDILLPTTVASGTQVTFTFTLTAPIAEGVYNCQWQMSTTAAGGYFGASTLNVAITVSNSAPAPGPTNLTATPGVNSITLNWQNNVASNYIVIERKVGSGTFSQLTTVAATATSYVDSSLPAGTYTYRVRCFVGNGSASTYSNEASATVGGTAPAAPSGLTAALGVGLQVNLSWVDNSNNETGFKIERRTSTGSYALVATVGINVVSYQDNTVSYNTQYFYRVKAINGALESAYSNEASVTTGPPPPPTAPSTLTATALSCTQVNLSWLDNSSNEDGFKVERKTGTGAFSLIATLAAGTQSYSDLTAAAATQYTYQVRAYSTAGGDSTPSNQATVTTPVPPTAPTSLTATAISSSSITLSWMDTSATEQGFKIERKTGTGAFVELPASVGASVQTYSDTGLTASTPYTYQVRAYSGTVFSAYAGPATATTQAAGSGAPCPTVSVLSGSGTYGYAEGSGTAAQWRKPVAGVVAKDPLTTWNTLFIADTENHRIRKVYLEGTSVGQSSLIAGDGIAGYSEGAGFAPSARYNNPCGIAVLVNAQGLATTLLIADTNNHVIRQLTWGGNGSWTPSLFCGATPGSAGYVEGGSTTAKFSSPQGIVVAPDGNIYVADTGNGVIRKLDQFAFTTTLAGGVNQGIGTPVGITASANSTLYVSDSSTHRIFQVTSAGSVSVLAGSGLAGFADGTGTAALFNTPGQLVWANPTGGAVLFIADQNNHRIRRLLLTTNAVNTHAGTGLAGFADGSCSVAQFNAPRGMAYFSSSSLLYVLDTNNNRIRKLQ